MSDSTRYRPLGGAPTDSDEVSAPAEHVDTPGAQATITAPPRAGHVIEESSGVDEVCDPDRYQLIAEHGRGGLGRVVRAVDRKLGRTVAIKELLHPGNESEARFVQEALITARLEHPSIVAVHDAGRWPSGDRFYSMKLVSGEPLRDAIAKCATLAERLQFLPNLIAVVDAIAYAHSEGIIHRDLKPGNIIVGAFGETIVIDWGLAKELGVPHERDAQIDGPYRTGSDGNLTVAGSVLGTPAFMSPEQAEGRAADARSDVYALGAVLWFIVTGRPPVLGDSADEVLERLRGGAIFDVEAHTELPAELSAIARKALARLPGDRYPDAGSMASDLRSFQAGNLVAAHTYSIKELVRRWCRRNRGVLTAAIAALVAVAVLATIGVRRIIVERDRADLNASRAKRQLAESYYGQGRRAYLGARTHETLHSFRKALELGYDSPALRLVLGQAVGHHSVEIARIDTGGQLWETSYSHDGSLVATAGLNGVHLIDVQSGKLIAHLDAGVELRSARFSPDDTRMFAGGQHGTLTIWALDSREPMRVITAAQAEHDAVVDVASDEVSRRILVGHSDGQVALYSENGTPIASRDSRHGMLWRAALTPDGRLIVTAGMDGFLRLWRSDTLEPVGEWRAHEQSARNIDFSSSGNQLASAGYDGRAAVWDLASRAQQLPLPKQPVPLISARFGQSDRLLVTSGLDPIVRVWSLERGEPAVDLVGHDGVVYWAGFLREQVVLTASWDGTARLWDISTGKEVLRTASHSNPLVWAAASPRGESFTTVSFDGTAMVWSAAVWPEQQSASTDGAEISALDSVSGGRYLIGSEEGRLMFVDADGRVEELPSLPSRVGGLAASQDGRRIIALSGDHIRIIVRRGTPESWDVVERGVEGATAVAISDDGAVAAVGDYRGTVHVFEVPTARKLGSVIFRDTPVVRLSLDATGTRIAIGDSRGTVAIARPDGAVEHEIDAHDRLVAAASFSPDGGRLATAGFDGATAIWAVSDGQKLASFESEGAEVAGLSWSPDGAFIATAARDRVSIWDPLRAEKLLELRGHRGEVMEVFFAPEGLQLGSSAMDGRLVIWTLHPATGTREELIQLIDCAASSSACREGRTVSEQPTSVDSP